MRKYQVWTGKDLEFLRQNYKSMTAEQMGNAMGRSKYSVSCQLNKMNLSRTKKRGKWYGCEDTPENCRNCYELYGYKECVKPAHLCSEENRGYSVNPHKVSRTSE